SAQGERSAKLRDAAATKARFDGHAWASIERHDQAAPITAGGDDEQPATGCRDAEGTGKERLAPGSSDRPPVFTLLESQRISRDTELRCANEQRAVSDRRIVDRRPPDLVRASREWFRDLSADEKVSCANAALQRRPGHVRVDAFSFGGAWVRGLEARSLRRWIRTRKGAGFHFGASDCCMNRQALRVE